MAKLKLSLAEINTLVDFGKFIEKNFSRPDGQFGQIPTSMFHDRMAAIDKDTAGRFCSFLTNVRRIGTKIEDNLLVEVG